MLINTVSVLGHACTFYDSMTGLICVICFLPEDLIHGDLQVVVKSPDVYIIKEFNVIPNETERSQNMSPR